MTISRSRWSVVSAMLYLASGLSALAAAWFGYLYYAFYWQWRGLFNGQGRYFHAADAAVYHDQASFLVVPALALAMLAVVLLLGARASRRRARGT